MTAQDLPAPCRDSGCYAAFLRALDSWMMITKPHLREMNDKIRTEFSAAASLRKKQLARYMRIKITIRRKKFTTYYRKNQLSFYTNAT